MLLLLLCASAAQAALDVVVRVEGVGGDMEKNVLEQLSVEQERQQPLLDIYRLRRLHQQAPEEIRTALRPFGYYRVQVESSLEQQDGRWVAHYRINPGPPVHITALDVAVQGAAATDPAFTAWREAFPLHLGDVLDHAAYDAAKRDLLQLARDRGYFDARLERHRLAVDVVNNSATVELVMASGPRARFGEPHFDYVALEEPLLRRYLTFTPGDPYDADRLFALQRALADSDYFEFVEVRAAPAPGPDGRVPVDIHLRLRPDNRYTFGLGYGTDTGARASAGMERRRVNKEGHRASLDTSVSQVGASVKASYRIPLQHPASDFFAFTTGWEREVLDTSTRETLTVGGGLTQQIGAWQRSMALTVQNERYTVADQQAVTTLVLPSIGWQRVEADDRLFPQHGWRLAAELRGASETLGSDASLLQGVLRAKAVAPLWGGRLITRADLGASDTPDFERVPASLRFFAGGDNSVRGYAYKSLGPTDASGQVVGGRHLAVFSAEYDHYFGGRFGAAIFFDAGNAFDNEQFVPQKGAGVGLRWRLPFGALRVDVASPVRADKPDWRLHLTIGPDL